MPAGAGHGSGLIRRVLLATGMAGGTLFVATLVHDTWMIRAEGRAVEEGRIEDGARLAGRVRLLRPLLGVRLKEQIRALAEADRRFPREEPLIRALLATGDDAEMAGRLAALRVLAEGPEHLDLTGAEVAAGAAVEAPGPPAPGGPPPAARLLGTGERLLLAEPLPSATPGPLGPAYMLIRRNPAGAVIPLGTGVAGPWGHSWDVSADGRVAVVGRPDERLIERWELPTSQSDAVPVPAGPTFLALQPAVPAGPGDAALAFSGPARPGGAPLTRSEALWLRKADGAIARIFPPPRRAAARLGFAWAPDGRSLLVRTALRLPEQPGDPLQLDWIAPDGRALAATVIDPADPAAVPRWVPGPGARMGLVAGGAGWVWDGRGDAVPLTGVRGEWGWSPDGRLIAGLDVGHVFVAVADEPARRVDHKVAGLAPFFVLEPRGFSWDARGIGFTGRSAPTEKGPWRLTRVSVHLAAAEGEGRGD